MLLGSTRFPGARSLAAAPPLEAMMRTMVWWLLLTVQTCGVCTKGSA